jgi:hypothetical protein
MAHDSKWCDTCIWWQFQYDDGLDKFGRCHNEDVNESVRIANPETTDDNVIFTKDVFGCTWHQKGSYSLFEIKNPLK